MKQYSPSPTKPWWRDPSTLGDVTAVIAASIAVVLTVLDLLDLLEVGWFRDNLAKLTLLLVSLMVIFDVVERRFLLNRLHVSLLEEMRRLRLGPYQGLTSVYSNRLQLPPYPEMVQSATKEIFVSGIEFGYIALHQIPTLERKAVSGCKIKLLMVDPGSDDQPNPLLEPLQETFAFPQLGELLRTNLSRLSQWKSQLPTAVGRRIEIRVTRAVPTHIVTFLDKDLPSGKMYLEMIPPRIDVTERWLVLIEANKGGELYSRYTKAYDQLWSEAQPWS